VSLALRLKRLLPQRVKSIRVEIRGNGVVLSGKVKSFYEKQLAQEAIKKAIKNENLSVYNEIEVLQ
jgi:osmotically-inducible protein OsmY